MDPALASVIALIIAIVLSMVSRINVGLVAIALAWIVGVYIADLKPDAVMGGFPATLFLTLTGVTLLFACAETNGTLENLAHRAVSLARGNASILPILFFFIAFAVSSVGPGAISSVALIVPLAMAIGIRAKIPYFLTALMVANGANAGNLSPISAVGVIANTKMNEAGLGGHEGKVFFANFVAHLLVAIAAYFIFREKTKASDDETASEEIKVSTLSKQQLITCGVIVAWIIGVLVFKLNLGLSAFVAIALLILTNASEETAAIKKVPWTVIVMVCGVSVLIAILEKTGGMEHFTTLLSQISSASSINGIIAFITGIISTYSSTSGVVLPAFLPTATKLAEQMGGGNALGIALSINVGSSIVDVSPLSTLGALCIATISDPNESKKLFKQMLIWGLAMSVVGAIFCQLFSNLIANF